MVGKHNDVEKRLWDAADQLRANSKLKSSEYSVPVLGLIFLRGPPLHGSLLCQPAVQSHGPLAPINYVPIRSTYDNPP